ncbi:MAG TPA: hypothetical protein VFB62_21670, partial [Polyangiaceae bacterium]|nr:hypothetical protein [Polyangiaceae bacterium]
LSRREASVRPMPSHGNALIDASAFARNLLRCAPEPGLDAPTLWALGVAKGNRAERYGVEHKLETCGFEKADAVMTYVELQECYHTRLLLQVLELVGLRCHVGDPVGAVTRAGVRLIAHLPRCLRDVLALAFEVVGIGGFCALRDEARVLFAREPQLGAIDALFTQILVDEVGHVHFLRSCMGPGRLMAARRVLTFAKSAMFDDNREVASLLERHGYHDLEHIDLDRIVADAPERLRLPPS